MRYRPVGEVTPDGIVIRHDEANEDVAGETRLACGCCLDEQGLVSVVCETALRFHNIHDESAWRHHFADAVK